MSINCVMISGNLTRDAELRNTSAGFAIMKMGVAVNDRQKNRDTGEWEDYPNYIDCTMFGKRAEALASKLTRGTKVAICGKLRYSTFEKNGERRNKIEVIVDEIEVMPKGERAGGGNGGDPRGGAANDSLYDTDIPF